jgi:hypothetical protein
MDIAELFRLYQKNPKEYRRYIDCLEGDELKEVTLLTLEYIKKTLDFTKELLNLDKDIPRDLTKNLLEKRLQ